MSELEKFFPSKEELLELEPEDLAPSLLKYLNHLENNRTKLNRYNFGLMCQQSNTSSDTNERNAIGNKFMDAWMWLESEGFLGPTIGDNGEWRRITERGRRVLKENKISLVSNSKLLPKKLIHPLITEKVWLTFIRGDFDTAIGLPPENCTA